MPLLPNFSLTSIQELRFEYLDYEVYNKTKLSKENISLDYSFKEEFNFHESNLQIFSHLSYSLKTSEGKGPQLLHSDVLFNFNIPTLKEYEDNLDILNINFLPLPLGISISTVRGIIYTRTLGSSLNQFFMPVLNPMELVKQKFAIKS